MNFREEIGHMTAQEFEDEVKKSLAFKEVQQKFMRNVNAKQLKPSVETAQDLINEVSNSPHYTQEVNGEKMNNKKELIKKIDDIGNTIINSGIFFKQLSKSIDQRKDEKTLKEWKEFIKPYIDKYSILLKGGKA